MTLDEFHTTIMQRPREYAVFGATKANRGFIVETDYPNYYVGIEHNIFVDTRYVAKMRLYKYLLKKYNVYIPTYGERMGDAEIGASKPILNF